MNTEIWQNHATKIRELVHKYQSQGYQVILEPDASDLPMDLAGYRPDLLVKTGDTGYIIEVKTSRNSRYIEKYKQIADIVSSKPGWKFLLVTTESSETELPKSEADLPSWNYLFEQIKLADQLLVIGALDPALLFVWSVFEAGLRRRATEINLPTILLDTKKLVKHLYTEGEISVDTIDDIMNYMHARNLAAHGKLGINSKDMVNKFVELVHQLFNEWEQTRNE